jgi:hypothetical protein
MKTARQQTRDRHEDRCEREEKLGAAMETLPGKTLRDRISPAPRRDFPRSKAASLGVEIPCLPRTHECVSERPPSFPQAHFSLFAPNAESVYLAGAFNQWNPTGTKLRRGPKETGTLKWI